MSRTVCTANSRLNRIRERSTVAVLRNSGEMIVDGVSAVGGLRSQRSQTNGQIRERANSQNRMRDRLRFSVSFARLAADSHRSISGLAEANSARKMQLINTGTTQTAMPEEMPGRFSAPMASRVSRNGANTYSSRRA